MPPERGRGRSPPGCPPVGSATCFHVFMHLDPATIERARASIATLVRPGGHLPVDIPSRHRRAWKVPVMLRFRLDGGPRVCS